MESREPICLTLYSPQRPTLFTKNFMHFSPDLGILDMAVVVVRDLLLN